MYRNLKYVLYHGTIATIEEIDINQGKGRKDFGKGFLLPKHPIQFDKDVP